jgi:hypothetical protein
MASAPSTEAHRDTAKIRREMRRKECKMLGKIEGNLKRRWRFPILTAEQLIGVGVARRAPLDIDSQHAMDFDPRYFIPGSPEDLELSIHLARVINHNDHSEWYRLQPLSYHRFRTEPLYHQECLHQALV